MFICYLVGLIATFSGSLKQKRKKEKEKEKENEENRRAFGRLCVEYCNPPLANHFDGQMTFVSHEGNTLLNTKNIRTMSDFIFNGWIIISVVGGFNPKTLT